MHTETAHQLWQEFHALPAQFPAGPLSLENKERARIWLEQFTSRVGIATQQSASGCACGSEWHLLSIMHPPDLRSQFSLLIWGQQQHDRVNHRLSKPLWMPLHQPAYAITFGPHSDITPTPPA
jgi:hypothetical protein